jgi:hypothetical protein
MKEEGRCKGGRVCGGENTILEGFDGKFYEIIL